MKLVATLVEVGGEDLATNQRTAVFRNWCAADVRLADEVIAAARGGDPLAVQRLIFTLEAKADVEEAYRSADADGDERAAAVLTLSRMTLGTIQSARAVEMILDAAENASVEAAGGLVKAALGIAEKVTDPDRSKLVLALDRLARTEDTLAVYLIATAHYWHGDGMTDDGITSCLRGLQNVDPMNDGTVRQIKDALETMWPGRLAAVGEVMFKVLPSLKGRVGIKALGRIMSSKKNDDDNQLRRMSTEWLLSGDHHVCSAIASHVSEINYNTPCFQISADVLPDDPIDQMFVCRKAIGHFYLSPMTSASWAVAILRVGGDAFEDAAELLFDRLLLNYGGALEDWLELQLETEASGNDKIRTALTHWFLLHRSTTLGLGGPFGIVQFDVATEPDLMSGNPFVTKPEIRKLRKFDTPEVVRHLLRLDPQTRRSRFGVVVKDGFIRDYAADAIAAEAIVFGAFFDDELRAIGELRGISKTSSLNAELALSVESGWQNLGIGSALFSCLVAAAQNRGIRPLQVLFLSENKRMQKIAAKYDHQMTFDNSQVEPALQPPWATPVSFACEMV